MSVLKELKKLLGSSKDPEVIQELKDRISWIVSNLLQRFGYEHLLSSLIFFILIAWSVAFLLYFYKKFPFGFFLGQTNEV